MKTIYPPESPRSSAAGFTLIELLVVLGLLSLLVTALYPSISRALGAGEDAETQARLNQVTAGIDAFQARYGVYPPDNFAGILPDQLPVKAKPDNGANTGNESLVTFLSWKSIGAADLSEHEDWIANTDGDSNGSTIPLLERSTRMELVDAWGVPFAYFNPMTTPYKSAVQNIRMPEGEGGEDVVVRPMKNPNSDGYLGKKYQLFSAGPDRDFTTIEDNISYPPLPR